MNLSDIELQSLYRAFLKAENASNGDAKKLHGVTVRALEELLLRRSKDPENAQINPT